MDLALLSIALVILVSALAKILLVKDNRPIYIETTQRLKLIEDDLYLALKGRAAPRRNRPQSNQQTKANRQ